MNNDDRVLEDSCPVCESQLEVVSVKFSLRRGAIAALACADCCRPPQHGSQQDSRLTKRPLRSKIDGNDPERN
jgi:hypothetical protein